MCRNIDLCATCRVKALSLSYGDAEGAFGSFENGSDTLVDLLNRVKVLEMPLLFRPNDGWCYVSPNSRSEPSDILSYVDLHCCASYTFLACMMTSWEIHRCRSILVALQNL